MDVGDLKRAVNELHNAVADFRREACDESKVRAIAAEVMRLNGGGVERRGYEPGDSWEEHADSVRPRPKLDGRDRFEQMHGNDPRAVAAVIARSEADVRSMQRAGDHALLLGALLSVDPRKTDFYADEYMPQLQAGMGSTSAGAGDEFVPTVLSGDLIERVNLELMVPRLFPLVVMPSNPFDVAAVAVNRQKTGKATEQTADTGQTKFKKITVATRKVTLTAAKFAVEAILSRELDEDTLIPILPFVDEELIDYMVADVEDTVINGDADGTHQDSDSNDVDDPRANFDGLRKLTLAAAKTDGANAALTLAMLRGNRATMLKYGVRAERLAHIVSIANYVQLLGEPNVQTLDKYGPAATVLTGELAKADGVPVIVSEYVRQDLNATGVHDGVTTDRSLALTVNRRGFFFGERRAIEVQVLRELYAESDQLGVIATLRRAFAPRYPAGTERVVAQTYNLST